jgi:5-methylcytosine-specific restriction protein B
MYQELARELSTWEDRQEELVGFLEELRTQGYVITPLNDRDGHGARILLREIDPFTFFGVFNRRIGIEQRLSILARMKEHFQLKSDLPEDFDGVPLLNNMKSWFFSGQSSRHPGDVMKLWRVFQAALRENPLESEEFQKAFDEAEQVKQTNINLTIGLFWIRPDTFLSLDQGNRA